MIREIAALTAKRVRKRMIHNPCTTYAHPIRNPYLRLSALCCTAAILTIGAVAPAKAVAPEVIAEFLTYCTEAVAMADPRGPTPPNGVEVNETGAILTTEKLPHFSMRRDARGDWVCEVGEKSPSILARAVDDYLRVARTVDKYRSTFGENPYVAATVCLGPNAVAVILNGPLSDELSIGTAVFSGGMVSAGCEG